MNLEKEPSMSSSPEELEKFAKETTPKNRKDWASKHADLVLKEAEMLEGGGKYNLDKEGNLSFEFSMEQLKDMKNKLKSSEARLAEDKVKILTEEKFKKSIKAFEADISTREREHEEIRDIVWEPIDFKGKFTETASAVEELNVKAGLFKHLSEILTTHVSKELKYESPNVREVNSKEYGDTANNRNGRLPEGYKNLLKEVSGLEVDPERITSVHYAYTPDGVLGAIVLTVNTDKSLSVIELEKEKKSLLKSDPTLLHGTFIVKKDGKKMFIPKVTWKQYPAMATNGRVVMTFADYDNRGIFDEDVCFLSGSMDTSTGEKVFFDGSKSTSEDDYYWRAGGVSRKQGRTNDFPKAHVIYNKVKGVLVYNVDYGLDDILREKRKSK